MKRAALLFIITVVAFAGCKKKDMASNVSRAGSMAQMIADGDRLYLFSAGELQVVDITDPSRPAELGKVSIGDADPEWRRRESSNDTISFYDRWILAGMNDGLTVLDASGPGLPRVISSIEHRIARDPVIGHKGFLYSTLRSTEGGTSADQLNIYRMRSPVKIEEIRTLPLWNPHGIDFLGETLLVADGTDGLKAYALKDGIPERLVLHERSMAPYDVLVDSDEIIISAQKELLRCRLENNALVRMGSLPVKGVKHVDGLEQIPEGDHAFNHFAWQKRWAEVKDKGQWVIVVLLILLATGASVLLSFATLYAMLVLTGSLVWLCIMAVRRMRRRVRRGAQG